MADSIPDETESKRTNTEKPANVEEMDVDKDTDDEIMDTDKAPSLTSDQHNKAADGAEKPKESGDIIFALDENIRVVDITKIGKELETMDITANDKTKDNNSDSKTDERDGDDVIAIDSNPNDRNNSALPTGKKPARNRDIIYTRPEDPLRTSPTPEREEIIIDLDDDSDTEERKRQRRMKKMNTCCNFNCTSGEKMMNAPVIVLTYYQQKYTKGKLQRVCAECFETAMLHSEAMHAALYEHRPLISTIEFPPRTDTVIIPDSDSDDSDYGVPLRESSIKVLQDHLMEVLEAAEEECDIQFQLDESKAYIENSLCKLEAESKLIDEQLNSYQGIIDKCRRELYANYTAPIQELPPLTISDSMLYNTSDERRTSPASPTKRIASNADGQKRSPITGVATKKVTQMVPQRTAQPTQLLPKDIKVEAEQKEGAVEVLKQVEASKQHMLPPIGTLTRPRPQVGDVMYVMKQGYYGIWSRAKVMEILPKSSEGEGVQFRIKFEYRKSNPVKVVNGRHMAYPQPCPVRLPVGTRVIALFRDEWPKECFYAGVIAEPPKSTNKYRYLVFFDDGYAQYVQHDKILLVCESSRNVWEDIHPESRDFVKNYLDEYPERPMVKLQQGQIVKTEWNGKWWIARVAEVDGSLVKMHFDADSRTEWIYRGSTRLGPLYAEFRQAAARKNQTQSTFTRHRGLGIASLKKRNMPYVEYTRTDNEELKETKMEEDNTAVLPEESKYCPPPVRAVAKKSTTKRPESIAGVSDSDRSSMDRTAEKSLSEPQGKIEFLQINTKAAPRKFRPHQCGPACMANLPHNSKDMKGYNPLVIPLLCGWQRHIVRYRGKRVVLYKAPCGRRLRNMEELHRYLRVTKSAMSVDQFDFDFWVHCFAEFILDDVKIFTNIKDLSYGAENVPVPCVNYVDHNMPDYVNYSTERQPMEGVQLNTNPEFLTGCDCTDDCQDREKCSCWQLTIQGTAIGQQGLAVDATVGYVYKRLPEPVMTGIYECNSRCKCASTCLNRVAQHPLQLRLQVFKTENRGWGIRCLNDIPQGSFICIYAGCLLTEQGANEGGKNYGDEYLAELDYIEVVERLKEGYESDALEDDEDCILKETRDKSVKDSVPGLMEAESDDEEEGELSQEAPDSDEEYRIDHRRLNEKNEDSIRSRLRKRTSHTELEDTPEKDRERELSLSREDRDAGSSKGSEKSDLEETDMKKAESPKKSFDGGADDFITLSDDEEEIVTPLREPSRFSAVTGIAKKEPGTAIKYSSVREFFGPEEYCYIMDAKNTGNIGRYLNHSCSPNVFVQNVFVDTHDLRFPWVAFFALTYIRAGTELTWDYNYDVGSVPGKVMHCHCGSADCRGRLL